MPLDATGRMAEVGGSERRVGTATPPCPVCGGGLVPTRSAWRCGRCGYALCAGCEPDLGCNHAAGDED